MGLPPITLLQTEDLNVFEVPVLVPAQLTT